jgi:predicted thioredoxin/glutaredoxin
MEKTLIVSDSCSACKFLIESLKAKGLMEKYHVLDITTPEGREVVEKLGITAIPDCVIIVREKEGDKARRCTEDEMKKILEDAGGSKVGT